MELPHREPDGRIQVSQPLCSVCTLPIENEKLFVGKPTLDRTAGKVTWALAHDNCASGNEALNKLRRFPMTPARAAVVTQRG